jgi:hypothetical protein
VTAKKHQAEGGRIGESARPFASQRAAITMAGRSGWSPMAGDEVGLARQVRQTIWELAGRSRVVGGRLDTLALATVKNRHRGAVDVLGREPILALLRRPGPGACSWCAARMLCAAAQPPKPPPPATAAVRALLGAQCSRCRVAYAALEVAEREDAHVAGLVAAEYSPKDASYQRPGAPRAPTRVIWSADQPQPETVTAALRAAGQRRRTPDPPYYRPRRRDLGGE